MPRKKFSYPRQRRLIEARSASKIQIADETYIAFTSNDYLGIAQHPKVVAALQEAASTYGFGSSSSAVVAGYYTAHQQFEQLLANYLGFEKSLLVTSGYIANLIVLATLISNDAVIFYDRQVHASIIDGLQFAQHRARFYRHLDYEHLESLLVFYRNKFPTQPLWIITEGVFSMEGDVVDLVRLNQLAQRYKAYLYVDDAHGFGVIEYAGKGVISQLETIPDNLVLTLGFGKAMGGQGGAILAQQAWIDTLIQNARAYIYTTGISPVVASGLIACLQQLQAADRQRAYLHSLIDYFQQQAQALHLPVLFSKTHIQILMVYEEFLAFTLSERLKLRGWLVHAMCYPTVTEGQARLRIVLTVSHTQQQIDLLLRLLSDEFKTINNQQTACTTHV